MSSFKKGNLRIKMSRIGQRTDNSVLFLRSKMFKNMYTKWHWVMILFSCLIFCILFLSSRKVLKQYNRKRICPEKGRQLT